MQSPRCFSQRAGAGAGQDLDGGVRMADGRNALGQLAKGDVLTVTRLDRLARSTRDLLNTLAAITAKGAGFRSLNDTWADTTTAHGRLLLTVLVDRL
jgi:DNA invertase Pin-like site-specific DNA recombinase